MPPADWFAVAKTPSAALEAYRLFASFATCLTFSTALSAACLGSLPLAWSILPYTPESVVVGDGSRGFLARPLID